MEELREAMYRLIARERPMTVRQVFYRLVGEGLVAKTETEYGSTVGRLLTEMRLEGAIPFRWIADNSRWMRKPPTYSGLGEVVNLAHRTYRQIEPDVREADERAEDELGTW